MAESKMLFPETWEEFRKQYRIVDTEKVYTNGIEMIPTFRVEQWLDHMESVKRSQQSEQNKMAQIAQIFGKKLGEEFMARLEVVFEFNCKFTNEGLKQEIFDGGWYVNDNLLRRLLTGEAEIVGDKE